MELLAALRSALEGGPTVHAGPPVDAPPGTALVVRTSGSTGTPRAVLLSASCLVASAAATHARLGGPGRWLLALPTTHIAGLQVLVRSALAGTTPGVLTGPFRSRSFVEAASDVLASSGPRYTALVPTQLTRLLAWGGSGLAALRSFDAVLVGGAALASPVLSAARAAGVAVVTTYGMTETAGGCVYDGVPLDGVRVELADGAVQGGAAQDRTDQGGAAQDRTDQGGAGQDRAVQDRADQNGAGQERAGRDGVIQGGAGRDGVIQGGAGRHGVIQGGAGRHGVIRLGGPTVAIGYLGSPPFDGWFETSDLGAVADGRLRVLGRADDVINTGGVKVAPAAVEEVLLAQPGVQEACVVGVADPEWGLRVAVAVVGVVDDAALAAVRAALGPAAVPRRVAVVGALPERGPGKVDRAAVAALFAAG
ncbi:AMP-binding protein [Actinokineospora sp. 24-640]